MNKLFLGALTILASGAWAVAAVNVTADFSSPAEYPLEKKINVYQTPLLTNDVIDRDFHRLGDLQVRQMRYELGLGANHSHFTNRTVRGTKANPVYDWANLDHFIDSTAVYCPSVMIAHTYMPTFLQKSLNPLSPPNDLNAWGALNATLTRHWKDLGLGQTYVEIWNEPDLGGQVFFTGTCNEYLDMYQYAAPQVADTDADVKVGGPAGAGTSFFQPLVERIKTRNLPCDFISGHYYGTNPTSMLSSLRSQLNSLGRPQAEMVMSEFAPQPTDGISTHAGGPVEHASAATAFFNAVETFLKYPDLTTVNWAQWVDPVTANGVTLTVNQGDKMGLIDGNTGTPKALFRAFELYGMMPLERFSTSSGSSIKSMASADSCRATLVVWNTATYPLNVNLKLNNLPFSNATVKICRIDTQNNSWYENSSAITASTPLQYGQTASISANSFTSNTLSLPSNGVLFVIAETPNAAPHLAPNPVAKVKRVYRFFPARDSSAPYALFDTKTWDAYLSMCTAPTKGDALIGVAAEEMPHSLHVTSTIPASLTSGVAGVRIDFCDAQALPVKAVTFYAGDIAKIPVPEWGTARAAERTVKMTNPADFCIDLTTFAPQGYAGRVITTFFMAGTPKQQHAHFRIDSADKGAVVTPPATDIDGSPLTYNATTCTIIAPRKGIEVADMGGRQIMAAASDTLSVAALPPG